MEISSGCANNDNDIVCLCCRTSEGLLRWLWHFNIVFAFLKPDHLSLFLPMLMINHINDSLPLFFFLCVWNATALASKQYLFYLFCLLPLWFQLDSHWNMSLSTQPLSDFLRKYNELENMWLDTFIMFALRHG